MNKFQPTLDKAPFALKPIRDDARRKIIDLLDSIRGKKALVLESNFVQPLSLIIDALTLKEHGVEMFCVVEDQNSSILPTIHDKDSHHLIYLIHSSIPSIHSTINHIILQHNTPTTTSSTTTHTNTIDYSILIIPRLMKTASLLLDRYGLTADVSLRSCSFSWIPLEEDILSLEYSSAYKQLAVDGDTSCLFDIAYALTSLQSVRGAIPHIQGKGAWAHTVQQIMSRLRQQQGTNAPLPGSSEDGIDRLILIDRSLDIASVVCTQLTYEGLLDEMYGVQCGQIRQQQNSSNSNNSGGNTSTDTHTTTNASDSTNTKMSSSSSSSRIGGLTSADGVYAETRDRFYVDARRWLNETLRSIQRFRDEGMTSADIAELKGFVADLRSKFGRMTLHTTLIGQLGELVQSPSFAARQRIEASLLDEQDDMESILDVLHSGEGVVPVLRLLCLYCAVHGGVPRKYYDVLRKDILNTYGSGHLVTMHAMNKAGLFQKKEGNPVGVLSLVKAPFKLLMEEGEMVDEAEPRDIHFTYAGYAPLSVRIVQHAVSRGGWSGVHSAMMSLPGKQFELMQGVDEATGMPIERKINAERGGSSSGGGGSGGFSAITSGINVMRKGSTSTHSNTNNNITTTSGEQQVRNSSSGKKTVMVCFIGGVTYAEISALRFLSRKGLVDCNFVIATTGIVNGNSLVSSLFASNSAKME